MKARVILWNINGNGKKWLDDNIHAERVGISKDVGQDFIRDIFLIKRNK